MWLLGSVLEPQECEQIDNELTYALDGLNGGSYSPYAPIVLGASAPNTKGLWVQSLLEADHLQGTVSAGLTLTVATGGQIDVEGEILVSGQQSAAASIQFGAYANLIFTSGQSEAIWDAGAVASFLAGAGFQMAGIGTVNGSSGTPATWTWGSNSSQTLDAGATVTDAATHTNTGPWTNTGAWVFSGDTVVTFESLSTLNLSGKATFGLTSIVNVNGATTLGMLQPAPSAATGANVLLSTLQVKAWCCVAFVNGNPPTLQDGVNVSGVTFSDGHYPAGNLLVEFGTNFVAPATYAVFGSFQTSDVTQPLTMGSAYFFSRSLSQCEVGFAQVFEGSGGGGPGSAYLNMSQATGVALLLFIGRQ